jgi:hypothetical protein
MTLNKFCDHDTYIISSSTLQNVRLEMILALQYLE